MFRKAFATIATAGALLGAGVATAGTAAAATPTHSPFYVQVAGTWVAEDQLTASQLDYLANDTNCHPVTFAVAVDQVAYIGGFPQPSIGTVGGRALLAESVANSAQLSQANFEQAEFENAGGKVPSFIGPDHYTVSANGAYSC